EFMQPVARDQAINVGIAVRDGKLWKLDVYDNLSEKLVITGHYADSLLKSAEGPFQYFNTDGIMVEKGQFVHGNKEGIWVKWNKEGIKMDSSFYLNDKWVDKYGFWENGRVRMEQHWQGKKMEQKQYREDGTLYSYQGFGDNGKLAFSGSYDEKGQLIVEKELTKAEQKAREKRLDSMMKTVQANIPEYPGGQAGFQFWVDNLRFPAWVANEMNKGEEVTITYFLDELGKATDITTSKSGEFTNYIRDQLDRSQPWKMKGYKRWGPVTFRIRF
ncbi:MAG TPA: hypothetical protein VKH37_10100, partial [Ferruginibacter sp.]|nr:hypothetical protein [Ferruginibacter sp.]